MRQSWMARGGKGIVILVVATFAFGAAVMLLWNALVPDLFHGPAITYWQAVGLLVLTHILFRGVMPWRGHRHRDHWRSRFEAKLASMTPEEQEKFRAEWKRRCGYGDAASS